MRERHFRFKLEQRPRETRETTKKVERTVGRGGLEETKEGLEIRLLHRVYEWEKPKALVTFPYTNLGRCTFRPRSDVCVCALHLMVGDPNRKNAPGLKSGGSSDRVSGRTEGHGGISAFRCASFLKWRGGSSKERQGRTYRLDIYYFYYNIYWSFVGENDILSMQEDTKDKISYFHR